MTNPEHWPNCATDGGPAHYECAVEEIVSLTCQIAMNMRQIAEQAAEITRLRALMTPQPIETAPKDGTAILVEGYDAEDNFGWRQSYWAPGGYWAWTIDAKRWLPLPEAPK